MPTQNVLVTFQHHPNPGPNPLAQTPPTSDPTEDATERTRQQLADLRELAGLAMKLARHTAQEGLEPSPETPSKRPDPRDVFNRLARTVRDCFALEARLIGAKRPEAPAENYQPTTMHDPRREFMSEYIHDAIEDSSLPKPTRAALHDQIEPLIDEKLAADPEITHVGGEFAIDICKQLGIPCKTSRMPDELLVLPGQTVQSAYADLQAARGTQQNGHDPP